MLHSLHFIEGCAEPKTGSSLTSRSDSYLFVCACHLYFMHSWLLFSLYFLERVEYIDQESWFVFSDYFTCVLCLFFHVRKCQLSCLTLHLVQFSLVISTEWDHERLFKPLSGIFFTLLQSFGFGGKMGVSGGPSDNPVGHYGVPDVMTCG